MKRVRFNVNQHVYVKLTERGLAFLKEENDAFWVSIGRPGPKYIPPKPDADGYYQFQLWDFISKFAPLFTIAADPLRYFETGTTLEFDAKSLERKVPWVGA